jgi:sporulation protein YlmC with PRC-barrel domain
MSDQPAGRMLDLNLHLLDRQVTDTEGLLVCKVDDLELEPGEDGALYVAAILVGSRALGRRIGGRLGRWIISIANRQATTPPPRIDISRVRAIGSAVTLDAHRADLGVAPLDDWVDRHVISRIPGSRHESE